MNHYRITINLILSFLIQLLTETNNWRFKNPCFKINSYALTGFAIDGSRKQVNHYTTRKHLNTIVYFHCPVHALCNDACDCLCILLQPWSLMQVYILVWCFCVCLCILAASGIKLSPAHNSIANTWWAKKIRYICSSSTELLCVSWKYKASHYDRISILTNWEDSSIQSNL